MSLEIELIDSKNKEKVISEIKGRGLSKYASYEEGVKDIVSDVAENGDKALFSYTKKFDGVDMDHSKLIVTDDEIKEAYETVSKDLLDVIRKALVSIRSYHEKQKQNGWFTTGDGIILGQKVIPLENVGVYVPGGKAVYPSSVLMNIVPAKVAGVEHIYMCTPPGKDGKVADSTLVAAHEAGADVIYKVGGAQAIAKNGIRYRIHPEGRQDRRTWKCICCPCKEGSIWKCINRLSCRSF